MGSSQYQQKSRKTIDIEMMLQAGHSVTDIARWANVSKQRISYIKQRLSTPSTPVSSTPAAQDSREPASVVSVLKTLQLHMTPSVYDALLEACASHNRHDPNETLTTHEYVEELVINRVVELGLLRKRR